MGAAAAKNAGGMRRSPALLKDRAYAAIKRRLMAGQFPPGTFLSERFLVAEMGMSKTPIRTALETLQAEGLVTISPRQGILVREPSVHEIADLFALRFALERYALESVAGRLTPDQIRRVRQQLRAQQQAAQKDDLAACIRLDSDFHLLFPEFLGNGEIIRVMRRSRERISFVIGLVFQRNAERKGPSWREHQGIAEAVISGDAGAAVERLREHLEFGKRMLLSRP